MVVSNLIGGKNFSNQSERLNLGFLWSECSPFRRSELDAQLKRTFFHFYVETMFGKSYSRVRDLPKYKDKSEKNDFSIFFD